MPKLVMAPAQRDAEFKALADLARALAPVVIDDRFCEQRARLVDEIERLAGRLEGHEPLPRKRSDAIVFMPTRSGSKRVQVQSVRGHFGL